MTLGKTIGKYLLGFSGLWIGLYLLAGFSMRQSTAIVLLAGVVGYAFWAANSRPDIVFVPHAIRVQPRWDRILLDLGLVATTAEYDHLREPFDALPPDRYNVFRDGMWFTVLKSEQFGPRTLVYSNDFHTFVSEVDFERNLAPLTVADESPLRHSPAPLGPTSPSLFVSYGVGGCSMGVIVHDWWWEKRRESIISKAGELSAREVFDCGLVRVTLAHISSSEFTLFWKRPKPYPKGDRVWKKHRDEDRAKLGWIDVDNSEEALRHQFYRLEHRYFRISHYAI